METLATSSASELQTFQRLCEKINNTSKKGFEESGTNLTRQGRVMTKSTEMNLCVVGSKPRYEPRFADGEKFVWEKYISKRE